MLGENGVLPPLPSRPVCTCNSGARRQNSISQVVLVEGIRIPKCRGMTSFLLSGQNSSLIPGEQIAQVAAQLFRRRLASRRDGRVAEETMIEVGELAEGERHLGRAQCPCEGEIVLVKEIVTAHAHEDGRHTFEAREYRRGLWAAAVLVVTVAEVGFAYVRVAFPGHVGDGIEQHLRRKRDAGVPADDGGDGGKIAARAVSA